MEIYIGKHGQVIGPYFSDEIQMRLDDGRLDGTELAWHKGLDEWVNVKELLEGEDEPSPETEEPSVEIESTEEPEPLDEETLEQVEKIKGLIEDGHEDIAWQLIQSLNNPRIYERLLEDEVGWRIDDWVYFSTPFYLEENGDLFIKHLGKLPEGKLRQLTELWLNGNQISDVSPLANLTQLKEVCLDSNQITDVSPLANLTELTELRLNDNRISDVSPLKDLTQLTYLDLGNNRISECDLQELQEALPDCDILRYNFKRSLNTKKGHL